MSRRALRVIALVLALLRNSRFNMGDVILTFDARVFRMDSLSSAIAPPGPSSFAWALMGRPLPVRWMPQAG